MKATAVFNEPKRCRDCPCYNGVACQLTNTQIGFARATLHRDSDCPLIAFPSKRKSAVEWIYKDWYENTTHLQTYEISDYDKGWNDCVSFLEEG